MSANADLFVSFGEEFCPMCTVKDLVKALQQLPENARVMMSYDGATRFSPDRAWLARRGYVVLAYGDDPIDFDEDRPAHAPSKGAAPDLWPDDLSGVVKVGAL